MPAGVQGGVGLSLLHLGQVGAMHRYTGTPGNGEQGQRRAGRNWTVATSPGSGVTSLYKGTRESEVRYFTWVRWVQAHIYRCTWEWVRVPAIAHRERLGCYYFTWAKWDTYSTEISGAR